MWHLGRHLGPVFTPFTSLPHTSNWSLSPDSSTLPTHPASVSFFSTHSASRFIFLKHTSDDIILLKSFKCPQLQVPPLQQGREPSTGCSPSHFLSSGLPRHIPSHQDAALLLWGQILYFSSSGLCWRLSPAPQLFRPSPPTYRDLTYPLDTTQVLPSWLDGALLPVLGILTTLLWRWTLVGPQTLWWLFTHLQPSSIQRGPNVWPQVGTQLINKLWTRSPWCLCRI